MRAAPSVGAVTGPALVSMAAPLYAALQSPSVRMPGASSSHTFFFWTWLGSRGEDCRGGGQQRQVSESVSSRQQQ